MITSHMQELISGFSQIFPYARLVNVVFPPLPRREKRTREDIVHGSYIGKERNHGEVLSHGPE